MGGSGKQSPPSAPDFQGAAEAQTNANRPNQRNPFGSTTWTRTGGPSQTYDQWSTGRSQNEMQRLIGNTALGERAQRSQYDQWAADPANRGWEQNTQLNPQLQGALDSLQAGLSNQLDPTSARNQAIDAAYGQATSRLDPQYAQRAAALETQLANQGLTRGSEAFDNAMRDFTNQRNDSYAQAMYNAQTGAGSAAFGQSLAANMQPYAQMGALQGLLQQNGFMPAADMVGALGQQYSGQMNQYGIDQAGKNSMLGGMAGLGGAAILASDERLKDNIERLAWDAIPGVPFASWEWKHRPGERQLGVIAQDLENVRPDLVITKDGLRYVNYAGLWEARNG